MVMRPNLLIIVLIVKCTVAFEDDDQPVITLPEGQIQGEIKESRNENLFAAFEGIPYAKPPIGNLRFEESTPPEPWSGIRLSKQPELCLQFPHNGRYDPDNTVGNEDCLYLNVYTPTIDETANYSVIVLVDGGAFMFGSTFHPRPALIMDIEEVVYVTVQYRLGILGFLSTENELVPGNNALKDQVLALKWVQKNIHLFGGNPQGITIVGGSSGAASVHYHLLSPLSLGLFQGAMSFSGSALNPWALTHNALEKAKKLATSVGCETENLENMVICLKKPEGKLIVAQVPTFFTFLYHPLAPFSVVIEKDNPKAFISKHPKELIQEGHIQEIPWLLSYVEREGLYPGAELIANETYLKQLNDRWEEVSPDLLTLRYTLSPELQNDVANRVRRFYLGDKPISRDTFLDVIEIINDRFFFVGFEKSIRLHNQVNKAPVYTYKFNYRGDRSLSDFFSKTTRNFGASHTDDMLYMFSPPPTILDQGNGVTELMLGIVSSFVKTGKPAAGDINWVPACCTAADDITYLNINAGDDISLKQNNSISNLKFWDSLGIKD